MKIDRKILPPSEIQSPMGDQGAEGTRSPEPKSGHALGDETAHGDPSLKAWRANAHNPGLGVGICGDGAAGITIGGE